MVGKLGRGTRSVCSIAAMVAVLGWVGCADEAATPDAPAAEAGAGGASANGGSGGASGGSGGATAEAGSQGAVQKGPFIQGSSITISLLNAELDPTGQNFSTATINDVGEFTANNLPQQPLGLQGDGFYYNELTGNLSGAELTLRGVFIPGAGGTQSAYVNIITHLTHQRVRVLVKGGSPFAAAVAQAEQELMESLGLTLPGFNPDAAGVGMNLAGGDSDANAYLFGVSSTIVQAANDEPGGSLEAKLQELLNVLASDLDGTLTGANTLKIRTALTKFDVGVLAARFRTRLDQLGSVALVPDMNRVLDQDRDGLVNALDNCPATAPRRATPRGAPSPPHSSSSSVMRTTRSLSPAGLQLPFSTTTMSVLEPGTVCRPSAPHSVLTAPSSVSVIGRKVVAGVALLSSTATSPPLARIRSSPTMSSPLTPKAAPAGGGMSNHTLALSAVITLAAGTRKMRPLESVARRLPVLSTIRSLQNVTGPGVAGVAPASLAPASLPASLLPASAAEGAPAPGFGMACRTISLPSSSETPTIAPPGTAASGFESQNQSRSRLSSTVRPMTPRCAMPAGTKGVGVVASAATRTTVPCGMLPMNSVPSAPAAMPSG